MSYVIAVFRNRTISMSFANNLRKFNVQSEIISTPKELGSTCGVSVKFPVAGLPKAKYLLNAYKYSSFVNFYKVMVIGNRRVFEIAR